MLHGTKKQRSASLLGALALMAAGTMLTGCTVDIAGQTHPNPFYLSDDLNYYAPGPEFKLAKEAAALKAQSEAITSGPQSCCP